MLTTGFLTYGAMPARIFSAPSPIVSPLSRAWPMNGSPIDERQPDRAVRADARGHAQVVVAVDADLDGVARVEPVDGLLFRRERFQPLLADRRLHGRIGAFLQDRAVVAGLRADLDDVLVVLRPPVGVATGERGSESRRRSEPRTHVHFRSSIS